MTRKRISFDAQKTGLTSGALAGAAFGVNQKPARADAAYGDKPFPDAPDDSDVQETQARELTHALAQEGNLQRLRHIVDLLPCYVILVDANHRIRFHNKTFEQFFGAPGDNACYAVLRNTDAPCRFCPPLDVLASGSSCVMEWVSGEGKRAFRVYSYLFVEKDGSRLVLQVGFNVTANVRVQQALDISEQSYRAITDNLSIGIAMLSLDLGINAGNSRLSIWFGQGFSRGRRVCEVLQCNGSAAVPKSRDAYCPDCPFQIAIIDGASHEKEFTVSFQEGGERIVRLVACPVAPRHGAVRALIMMLEDVTNRLRVNQQLQRVRKLEAMSTLAGGIAHEINQPLSALHLYASGLQMLLEKQGALTPETTQERLGLIMREADKIRSIITHMRSLIMQEGKVPPEPVDLAAVLRNSLGIMDNQMTSRGILLLLSIPGVLPPVRSNAVQLEQVMVNLIGNAVHALDSIGSREIRETSQPAGSAQETDNVSLTAGERRGAGPRRIISISARVENDGSRVLVEVADSGPGLPKGSERIFDPFYTTKESHKGMGLGLSIVHGLVSLWGGEVRARAHHPKLGGAVFYVILPVFADAVSPCSSPAQTPTSQ
jgi:signal transduction histidine kinase